MPRHLSHDDGTFNLSLYNIQFARKPQSITAHTLSILDKLVLEQFVPAGHC
jgi:hypothetical protein